MFIVSYSLSLYEGRYGNCPKCMLTPWAAWLCMFGRLQHAHTLHTRRYGLQYNLYLSSFRCDLSGSNFLCPNGSLHNFLNVTDQFVVKSLVCVSLNVLLPNETNLCSWKFVPFLLLYIPYSPLQLHWFVVIKLLPLHCNCCLQSVNLSACYLTAIWLSGTELQTAIPCLCVNICIKLEWKKAFI